MMFSTSNEMISTITDFIKHNRLNDYSIKVEKHTYATGVINYYVDMKVLGKYRI